MIHTDEALKLALEALNNLAAWNDGEVGGHMDEPYSAEVARRTITAIKEALANEALEKMAENARELGLDYEPEQEPVAWRYRMSVEDGYWVWNYATYIERQKDDRCEPLYTTPPQRTWTGLTDGEVDKMILLMGFPPDWITENAIVKNIVRNLEAKLKEKNT